MKQVGRDRAETDVKKKKSIGNVWDEIGKQSLKGPDKRDNKMLICGR